MLVSDLRLEKVESREKTAHRDFFHNHTGKDLDIAIKITKEPARREYPVCSSPNTF